MTVLELVNEFSKASGTKIAYSIEDRRAGDVPKLVCDASLAQKELGWSPKKSVKDMCKFNYYYFTYGGILFLYLVTEKVKFETVVTALFISKAIYLLPGIKTAFGIGHRIFGFGVQ